MEILFKECQSPGYKARTMINASADVTIAIAADFTTAGEICTRNCVKSQNKLYLDVNIKEPITLFLVGLMAQEIHKLGKSGIILNIAGNGIYTMDKYNITQHQCNVYMENLLGYLITSLVGVRILEVWTGGQTGIDQAGAIAANEYQIPTSVLAPRGWLFRDITGKDIASKELFKARFK